MKTIPANLLSIAVIGLCLAAAQAAQKPLASQAAASDTRGTKQQPLAIEQPVSVEVTNLPVPPPPPVPAEPPKDRSGWFVAIATAALAAFTLLLWRATVGLVRGADETAKRELRAYVFVESPRIEHVRPNEQPAAHVPLKNYGRTPAYHVQVVIETGIGDNNLQLPESKNSKQSLGHLAPGGVFTTVAMLQSALTPQQYALLDAGKLSLYVHGSIHYFDAFGRPHWTNHQTMIGGIAGLRALYQGGDSPGAGAVLALVSCEKGNETDDDVRS